MLQQRTKREQNKAETRARLMAAARREFARKGYAGTSLRNITSQAGLTTGAFYNNFKDKKEIYLAILDELSSTLRNILEEAIQEFVNAHHSKNKQTSTLDLLRVFLKGIFKESTHEQYLFEILGRDGLGSNSEFWPYYLQITQGFIETMQRGLKKFIEAGFSPPYETKGLAQLSVMLIFSVIFYTFHDRSNDLEEYADTIAAMIHGGAKQLAAWRSDTVNAGNKSDI